MYVYVYVFVYICMYVCACVCLFLFVFVLCLLSAPLNFSDVELIIGSSAWAINRAHE